MGEWISTILEKLNVWYAIYGMALLTILWNADQRRGWNYLQNLHFDKYEAVPILGALCVIIAGLHIAYGIVTLIKRGWKGVIAAKESRKRGQAQVQSDLRALFTAPPVDIHLLNELKARGQKQFEATPLGSFFQSLIDRGLVKPNYQVSHLASPYLIYEVVDHVWDQLPVGLPEWALEEARRERNWDIGPKRVPGSLR